MVSLIDKSDFIVGLSRNTLARDFLDLLADKQIPNRDYSPTIAPDVASAAIQCLQRNDSKGFASLYTEFSRRMPDADTDWIYDDFVVFALVLAVRRFQMNPTWLINAIAIRKDSKRDGRKNLPSTFISLLRGNFESDDSFYEIVVVACEVLQENRINEARLNKLFSELWGLTFPFYESSSCLNMLSLKAIEITIRRKGLLNPEREGRVEQFLASFSQRTHMIAAVIVNLFYILLLLLGMWLTIESYSGLSDRMISFVSGILTLLGTTVLWFFRSRKRLTGSLTRLIRMLLGLKLPL